MPALDSGPYVWDDWLGLQDAVTRYVRPKSIDPLLAYLGLASDPRRLRIRERFNAFSIFSNEASEAWGLDA